MLTDLQSIHFIFAVSAYGGGGGCRPHLTGFRDRGICRYATPQCTYFWYSSVRNVKRLSALSAELLAGKEGFEPTTCGLTVRRSNLLSYIPMSFLGAFLNHRLTVYSLIYLLFAPLW